MEPTTTRPESPSTLTVPPSGDGFSEGGRPSVEHPRTTPTFWEAIGVLYARWKLIAGVTFAMALASVVIALLLPRWYAAEARVLQPESGTLSVLGMINQATGGLGSLLSGGEYTRYLAILTSRSMMEDVVGRFDLVDVYGIEEGTRAVPEAVEKLRKNVEFEVSLDYNHLTVRAFDRDRERAAAMANYMVAGLNERNAALSSQSARQTRVLVEDRLAQAQADLDSVRAELQAFQEQHGVVQLEAQTQAFMQSLASLRAEAARLEVQYQTLARQYGPDNPQVIPARDARDAAAAEVRRALGGQDALLPVAVQQLPGLARRYAELMQDQLIQQQVIETIYPLYEQALFQEQNEAEAVQVVDQAVPPVLPARPSRRLIVIGATLSALLLVCLYVLANAWLRRNAAALSARLHAGAAQAA
jgi:uncharacterized protein involved in exopolysaccharide biosynthesis